MRHRSCVSLSSGSETRRPKCRCAAGNSDPSLRSLAIPLLFGARKGISPNVLGGVPRSALGARECRRSNARQGGMQRLRRRFPLVSSIAKASFAMGDGTTMPRQDATPMFIRFIVLAWSADHSCSSGVPIFYTNAKALMITYGSFGARADRRADRRGAARRAWLAAFALELQAADPGAVQGAGHGGKPQPSLRRFEQTGRVRGRLSRR